MNGEQLQSYLFNSLQGEVCTLLRIGERNELVFGFGKKEIKSIKRRRDGRIISIERAPWEFRVPGGGWELLEDFGGQVIRFDGSEAEKKVKEILSARIREIFCSGTSQLRISFSNGILIYIHSKIDGDSMVDVFRPGGLPVISFNFGKGWEEE